MVVHTFNSSTGERGRWIFCSKSRQPEKPCLEKKLNNKLILETVCVKYMELKQVHGEASKINDPVHM